MPTHNRSSLLKRAIDSVINQSYKKVELIVVNDGSSDDTADILDAYKKKYGIIYINLDKPKGACHARNLAINLATGDFITGLDDDDEFEVNHILTLIENYDDNYSFIASSLKENNGHEIFVRNDGVGPISLDLLLHYNAVGNQVFTKTKYLKEIKGFDEDLPALQDYDTWIRLTNKFGQGLKLNSSTYIWHTGHEKGRISNNNNKRLLALSIFYNKHKMLMSKSHEQSNYILQKKIENRDFTIIKLVYNINKYNYKSAISLYMNLNASNLSRFWRYIKGKLNN
jgi:glycosyltransferase involved in cell wall biosynthesis